MKWLIHPIKTLTEWGLKSWLLGIVNKVLDRYADSVAAARAVVAAAIPKVESVLAFLRSLDDKLKDNKVTEDEGDLIVAEATALAESLVK
jgi:hypothetical protein